MRNKTIDKYVISIGDVKLRLILQTIMNHVYSLSDKIENALIEFNTPIDVDEIDKTIDSKVAEKLIELNIFVNSKISPLIEKLVKLEKVVDSFGDFEILSNKVSGLEKFIDKLDNIPTIVKEVKKKPLIKKVKVKNVDWGSVKTK